MICTCLDGAFVGIPGFCFRGWYFARWSWNNLQCTLKLNALVSPGEFKAFMKAPVTKECNYYSEYVISGFIIYNFSTACLLGQVSLKKKKMLEGRKAMEEDKSSGTLSRNEMKELNDLMVDFNEWVKTAKCTYFSTSVLISISLRDCLFKSCKFKLDYDRK